MTMTHRTKIMFFAFTGKAIKQTEKILSIKDGYECWDLKQFTLDEFIEALQSKIPPVNKNVLRNYKIGTESKDFFGITEKQFEQCSWGLLIPDTLEEGGFSSAETVSLLNLYSPNFLYPTFYVGDMGIIQQKYDKDPLIYFHTQDCAIFQTKEFVNFYKLLIEQMKYSSWQLDRIQSWDKEDWRLFVAMFLYSGLKDYENAKSSFGWQRESAEMATILEALFTADDTKNEEIIYRLCKRTAVLLSWYFPTIEKDIREMYKARSAFVHGSFFLQIAKDSPSAHNNTPIPDFNLLYKHKEYVRFALVAYLNLARILKLESVERVKSVMEILEQAVIDIKLREKLNKDTEKVFALMPKPTLPV